MGSSESKQRKRQERSHRFQITNLEKAIVGMNSSFHRLSLLLDSVFTEVTFTKVISGQNSYIKVYQKTVLRSYLSGLRTSFLNQECADINNESGNAFLLTLSPILLVFPFPRHIFCSTTSSTLQTLKIRRRSYGSPGFWSCPRGIR